MGGTAWNLNDVSISAQISGEPRTTVLIVVFLAPFIEEVLFRGYVFGSLRDHSRVVAYVVSCVLFAFLHVWQFAAGDLPQHQPHPAAGAVSGGPVWCSAGAMTGAGTCGRPSSPT